MNVWIQVCNGILVNRSEIVFIDEYIVLLKCGTTIERCLVYHEENCFPENNNSK